MHWLKDVVNSSVVEDAGDVEDGFHNVGVEDVAMVLPEFDVTVEGVEFVEEEGEEVLEDVTYLTYHDVTGQNVA